jgi:hypothetical protein
LHFFKVQKGSKVDVVSTHRLKPCHAPHDVQAAAPPRRGRPPTAKPSVVRQPQLSVSRQQSCHASKDPASKRLRRVSFADPVATSVPPPLQRPPPAAPDIKLGRPVRSTARPTRYTA